MKETGYEKFYRKFIKHSGTLIPVYLSGIILIGLIIYRLSSKSLSQDEKKKLLYGEIILSFITGIITLFFGLIMFFFFIHNITSVFIYHPIIMVFFNPFTLTLFRVIFKNKINDTILSSLTILSTFFSFIYISVVTTR
jgi:hypothetical protein